MVGLWGDNINVYSDGKMIGRGCFSPGGMVRNFKNCLIEYRGVFPVALAHELFSRERARAFPHDSPWRSVGHVLMSVFVSGKSQGWLLENLRG